MTSETLSKRLTTIRRRLYSSSSNNYDYFIRKIIEEEIDLLDEANQVGEIGIGISIEEDFCSIVHWMTCLKTQWILRLGLFLHRRFLSMDMQHALLRSESCTSCLRRHHDDVNIVSEFDFWFHWISDLLSLESQTTASSHCRSRREFFTIRLVQPISVDSARETTRTGKWAQEGSDWTTRSASYQKLSWCSWFDEDLWTETASLDKSIRFTRRK